MVKGWDEVQEIKNMKIEIEKLTPYQWAGTLVTKYTVEFRVYIGGHALRFKRQAVLQDERKGIYAFVYDGEKIHFRYKG